jgi:hypothetical protein
VLDDGARLLRFCASAVILGADQGTYYTSAQAHTVDNLEALLSMLKGGRGMEAVQLIRVVSLEGRAPCLAGRGASCCRAPQAGPAQRGHLRWPRRLLISR